jgi:DNA-binding transcriptional LysR family regulator
VPDWSSGEAHFRRGHLRYFVTVAEEGQITRAAARLQTSQPALSQAIAQLEAEVGFELLRRHARGVVLTPAGEAFLPKARAVVVSELEVQSTAHSLARASQGVLQVGFIGPPPTMTSPELFAAFTEIHPGAELRFRDLPFPRGATSVWLEEVDVAFCHTPALEDGIESQAVRVEPRAIVAHRSHPLLQRSDPSVADALDETFVSYHPDVQPAWAGFHSLDDHRGSPPLAVTLDRVITSLQALGTMTTGRAITCVPLADARLAQQVVPNLGIVPAEDAGPATISLVWNAKGANPLVPALAALAESTATG